MVKGVDATSDDVGLDPGRAVESVYAADVVLLSGNEPRLVIWEDVTASPVVEDIELRVTVIVTAFGHEMIAVLSDSTGSSEWAGLIIVSTTISPFEYTTVVSYSVTYTVCREGDELVIPLKLEGSAVIVIVGGHVVCAAM